MDNAEHRSQILDQFTRQADTFLQRHAQGHEDLLALMAECAGVGAEDTVLDVACGPGIVSCFFAGRVRHVTGLDMVPAMLERARRLQVERGLTNIEWKAGDSLELPFAEQSFDCVVTRFSFHHFLEPAQALREMRRVCRKGGTALVADVTPDVDTQQSFNGWEKLRDPSHTRALTVEEFEALGENEGMELRRRERFGLKMELEDLLKGSFPGPGDADRIRALFEDEIQNEKHGLGVEAYRENGAVQIVYPVTVMAWGA